MQLIVHSNVSYLDETNVKIYTSTHIYLSKAVLIPKFNRALITVA